MEPKATGFQTQMYAEEEDNLQELQDREAAINRLEVSHFCSQNVKFNIITVLWHR
jgi:hypothetical protein